MASTSRELVYQTVNFENPKRVPLELWYLPLAEIKYPGAIQKLYEEFDNFDTVTVPGFHTELSIAKGDPCKKGEFRDPWGCIFENIHDGVIGEVKNPTVKDWDEDINKIHIPYDCLSIDPEKINKFCGETDKFVKAGFCPRPFEQLQFIRGTVELYMDLIDPSPKMLEFIKTMSELYYKEAELWAKTDVDCLTFMDDWGSQLNLLISPTLWREYFKPIYKNLVQIAHSHNKKIFMHSDGNILEVYPDLIEIGVDLLNSQVFCMGIDNLEKYSGKITFNGEIDRQHLLPNGTLEEIDSAVKEVFTKLWKNGGVIGQCEFGDSKLENVIQVYKSWQSVLP